MQNTQGILKKPLLEFQYNDADTASLTIYLSAFLGVNPKKMQNKIDKYRKKGKILTLVIGGKKYGSQWVITDIQKIMRNSIIKETC